MHYAIKVVTTFPSLPPSPKYPPLPPAMPSPFVYVHGQACKFFGNSVCYTVLNIPLPILYLPICTF